MTTSTRSGKATQMIDPTHTTVCVITNAPGDEGCAYTLTWPSGQQVVIGDAQDAYWDLAGILDDAGEGAA